VPAWLGRFTAELAGAIQAALPPELQEHTKLLSHSDQLDWHEQTLPGGHHHPQRAGGDPVILRDHNDRLGRLETRTESLERNIDQGLRLLSEPTNQSSRLASERMDQGFRVLSDRIERFFGASRRTCGTGP
jgi:hypothetical protein